MKQNSLHCDLDISASNMILARNKLSHKIVPQSRTKTEGQIQQLLIVTYERSLSMDCDLNL